MDEMDDGGKRLSIPHYSLGDHSLKWHTATQKVGFEIRSNFVRNY